MNKRHDGLHAPPGIAADRARDMAVTFGYRVVSDASSATSSRPKKQPSKIAFRANGTKDSTSDTSLNYAIKTADNAIVSVTLANRFKREHIFTRPLTFNL